ncbi:serine acetyltransferase [Planctomycetota bacterium]|nr:serine acetyltransferase [Planctomycetota bacterium]
MPAPDFAALDARLNRPFEHLIVQGPHRASFPDRRNARQVCDLLLNQLFPGFFADREALVRDRLPRDIVGFHAELETQIRRALRYGAHARGQSDAGILSQATELADAAISALPAIQDLLHADIDAAFANDPAAIDHEIIILGYPSVEALAIQRFAHSLYGLGVPLLPRMLTEVAHSRTGIDIHPGATIGPSFFIDHGTGVVIGETVTIGAHCVLYQGVTLGAWNPTARGDDGELQRGQANKRHPDLDDHVTVYAGATILGGGTRIGHHSIIGGDVWLTHSVEPYSVVMTEEPRLKIRIRKDRAEPSPQPERKTPLAERATGAAPPAG